MTSEYRIDHMRSEVFSRKSQAILEKISQAGSIGISGHRNPDGDCIGACLAMKAYIQDHFPQAKVSVFLDDISDKFKFLPGAEEIRFAKAEDETFDLFLALDCSDPDRLNHHKDYFMEAGYRITIDHHITNEGFGDLCLVVPGASSTCEILFYMMGEEEISLPCAQALYTGIVHDTGVFAHTNTGRMTMEAAGALLEKGVNSEEIIDRSFYRRTYVQTQILGRALIESIMILDGRMIFSKVTKKDMRFYDVDSSDLDGIIDQLRLTGNVDCALFLHELDDGSFKASLRSSDRVDVSRIARSFGGGGHVKAAGCTVVGRVRDIVMNIAQEVENQLENPVSEDDG